MVHDPFLDVSKRPSLIDKSKLMDVVSCPPVRRPSKRSFAPQSAVERKGAFMRIAVLFRRFFVETPSVARSPAESAGPYAKKGACTVGKPGRLHRNRLSKR